MAMSEADRESIRVLADLLDEKELSEIEFEHNGLRVRVARSVTAAQTEAVPTTSRPPSVESVPPATPSDEADDATRSILSPMVGTFYAAPSPESPAFVQVGDRVRKGQVVCIIEAMKLMNEIESEHDGVVVQRLVEDAQGVEFGQALLEVKVD